MASKNINPWVRIWVCPKKVMRSILDTNPQRLIIRLAILGGIVSTFPWIGYLWTAHPDQRKLSIFYTLLTIVGGGTSGLFYLYIAGWLYKLTGSWLGGKGSFTDVKCAVGWSNYLLILAHLMSFLSVLVIPKLWLQAIFALFSIVIVIWGVVIFLNLLAEAHRFSAWRALLACLIAFVLVLVALMIVSLLVPLMAPLFILIGF